MPDSQIGFGKGLANGSAPEPDPGSSSRDSRRLSVSLVIPTMNAAKYWDTLQAGIDCQSMHFDQVLVVDSESNDGTAARARAAGYTLITIRSTEFNHGGTRQMAADRCTSDVIVFLTQDVCLVGEDCVRSLVEPYADPRVGATYGRQLPRVEAGLIESFARKFNYSDLSVTRAWEDRQSLGIRATFMSNSFGSYRRSALHAVGGFPSDVIMCEDAIVVARLLMAGWKSAYVAEAHALHSHPYSIGEQFRRYFDTGVCHHREDWMIESFGKASGEGRKFVISELKYLYARKPLLIPYALLLTTAKIAGYWFGLSEGKLPLPLKRLCSMHKGYWRSNSGMDPTPVKKCSESAEAVIPDL